MVHGDLIKIEDDVAFIDVDGKEEQHLVSNIFVSLTDYDNNDKLLEQLRLVFINKAWRNGRAVNLIDSSIKNRKLNLELVDKWFIKKFLTNN
jgi:hypothetical protein